MASNVKKIRKTIASFPCACETEINLSQHQTSVTGKPVIDAFHRDYWVARVIVVPNQDARSIGQALLASINRRFNKEREELGPEGSAEFIECFLGWSVNV